MVAEYIAKISGDASGLERAVKRANGITKQLEDNEILIKLDYDGNVDDLNKTIQGLIKECPELTIQFQYDINTKLLDDELEKIKNMEEFQIDIDTGKASQKIYEMITDIKRGYESTNDTVDITKKKITDLYKYMNTAKEGGLQIDSKAVTESLGDLSDELVDFVDSTSKRPIKLFELDKKDFDSTLKDAKNRAETIRGVLTNLQEKGAKDQGDVGHLQRLQDDIKIIKSDIADLQDQMGQMSDNGFKQLTYSVNELHDRLADTIEKVQILQEQIKTGSAPKGTLQDLYDDYQKWSNINKDSNPREYWDNLQTRIDSNDESLKNLLSDLKIFNQETGKLNQIQSGGKNAGGLIGDNNVLIARKQEKSGNKDLYAESLNLKKKLDEAAESGINVSRILDVIQSKDKNLVFELQEKARGNMLGDYDKDNPGFLSFINTDILEASDEQIQKLISDIVHLQDLGVKTDINVSNIAFDEKNGFSLYDLSLMDPTKDSHFSPQDIAEDIRIGIIGELQGYYEDAGNQVGVELCQKFSEKFDQAFQKIDFSSDGLVENAQEKAKDTGKKIGNALDEGLREGIDAHSDSQESKEATDDFLNGIVHEVDARIGEIESTGEKIGNALADGLEKSLLELNKKALDLGAYFKQSDQNTEIAALLDNGKLDLNSIQSNTVKRGQTANVKIPNGNGDAVFHSHMFEEGRDNLSFSYKDIQSIVSNGFNKAILMCGEEFETLDLSNVSEESKQQMLTEIRHMMQNVLMLYGASADENGQLQTNELSDDLHNEVVQIINSMLHSTLKQYGGSLSFQKKSGDSIVGNNQRILQDIPQTVSESIKAIQAFIESDSGEYISQLSKVFLEQRQQANEELQRLKDTVAHQVNNIPNISASQDYTTTIDQTSSQIDQIAHAENMMGNEAQEAAEQVKQGLSEILEAAKETKEELTTVYRGLDQHATQFATTSERYGTFASLDPKVAEQYTMQTGELLQAQVDLNNALKINGNGADWNAITYLGDGSDEASKKIISLHEKISSLKQELRNREDLPFGIIGGTTERISGISGEVFQHNAGDVYDIDDGYLYGSIIDFIEKGNALEHIHSEELQDILLKLYELEKAYQKISDAQDNVYGTHTTEEFSKLAKNNGFQAVVFENIHDTLDRSSEVSDIVSILDNAIIKQDSFTDAIKSTTDALTEQQNTALYKKTDLLSGDDALAQYIDELESAKLQSDELDESLQDALNISAAANSSGSALDLLNQCKEEIDENIEKAQQFDKYVDAMFHADIKQTPNNNFDKLVGETVREKGYINAEQTVEPLHKEEQATKAVTEAYKELKEVKAEVTQENDHNKDIQSEAAAVKETTNNIEKRLIAEQAVTAELEKREKSITSSSKKDAIKTGPSELDLTKSETRMQVLEHFQQKIQESQALVKEFQPQLDALYAELERAGTDSNAIAIYNEHLKQFRAELSAVSKANNEINSLKNRIGKLNADDYIDELSRKISDLQQETEGFKLDIHDEESIAQFNRIKETAKDVFDSIKSDSNKIAKDNSITNLYQQIATFASNNTAMSREAKRALDGLMSSLRTGSGVTIAQLKEIDAQFNKIKGQVADLNQTGNSFITSFNKQLKSANAQLIAGFVSLRRFGERLKQLATTVVSVDTAITELRKVSDASEMRLSQSFEKSTQTAKELGSTITEVINKTSDWSRLGYNIGDAEQLARISTLFQTVGDNMTSEDASSYMISSLQGFQMGADQALEIVDKYNEVANNFAIDTKGIGEALQRSAASFNAANTDLSKSIALVTATNTVVQDPASVGGQTRLR